MLQRVLLITLVAAGFSYLGLLGGLYMARQRFPQARFLYELTEQLLVLPAAGLGLLIALAISSLLG